MHRGAMRIITIPIRSTRLGLAELGHRIAEQGTASERAALEAIAASIRHEAPGIAAALVDWAGPEIVRLRAFGHATRRLEARAARVGRRRTPGRVGENARVA